MTQFRKFWQLPKKRAIARIPSGTDAIASPSRPTFQNTGYGQLRVLLKNAQFAVLLRQSDAICLPRLREEAKYAIISRSSF